MNAIERPIIYGFLLIALLFLWDARCSGNIGNEITVTVPEVKGTLQTSKPLNHTRIAKPIIKYISGKVVYKTITDSIDYLLAMEAIKMVDSFRNENDSLKLKMFADAVQPMDVTETLENDTIKISMLAKVSGTLHNVKLDYTIKPYKINIKTYALFLGSTIGNNTTNGKTFVSPQIMYLNPYGMIFYGGRDLFSDTYNIGVAKKIFGFSR